MLLAVSDIISAFNARISGDRSVDDYALFRDISSGIDSPGGRALMGKPLQWCGMMLDRWHRQYRTGKSDIAASLYDTLQCVSILMESDLWVFETRNERRYKQLLFDNHRHYLDAMCGDVAVDGGVDDETHLKLCRAYGCLLTASMPYLSREEYEAYIGSVAKQKDIRTEGG